MGSETVVRSRAALGLLPAAITGACLAFFLASGRWGVVGIWVEPSVIGWATSFADLANVTATSDCLINGTPVEPCDPYGRPFQPYVVLPARALAFLGLGLTETGYLGLSLAAMWTALIGALGVWLTVRWTRGSGELALALLALTVAAVAPPSLLAIERGTLDIVVVTLAAIGLLVIAASPRSLVGQLVGSISLSLAVVLKYFAIGVFAAFLAPRRWRTLPLIAAGLCVAFLMINTNDLLLARETANADKPSTTRILFSSTTGLVTLLTEDPAALFPAEGQQIDMVTLRIVGALIVAVWVVLFLLLLRHTQQPPYASWLLITGGGFLLLLPYFLGDSNDYRLIALVLPLAGLLRWRGIGPRRLWIPIVLILLALAMGSAMVTNEYGFLMPKPAIILGDMALAGALAFSVAVWLRGWIVRRERVEAPTE